MNWNGRAGVYIYIILVKTMHWIFFLNKSNEQKKENNLIASLILGRVLSFLHLDQNNSGSGTRSVPVRSNDANEQIPKQKKVPSSLSLVFVMIVNPEKKFRTPKVRKNICSFEAHGSSMYVVVKKLITKLII